MRHIAILIEKCPAYFAKERLISMQNRSKENIAS
jgi:hypothetical protein